MSTGEQKQAMPAPATVETAPIDLEAIINNTLRIRDQEQHDEPEPLSKSGSTTS